jgi:16S rRNA (uracil1498-N3)-methyltransferase
MSRPPRFLIATDAIADGIARIIGPELHHLRDVLRLAPGAEIALLDSAGIEHSGRLCRFETGCAIIEVTAAHSPPPGPHAASLILAAAIIKGPRMDFLVEKAAELGAATLWPLICGHSVAKSPGIERLMRWKRLAAAAAKQSLVPRSMEISAPLTVAAMAQTVPKGALAIVCSAGAEPLGQLLRRKRSCAIILACGPEGGFDNAEDAAMRATGFLQASLGRNRLRSETAGLAALAIAASTMDKNRGS